VCKCNYKFGANAANASVIAKYRRTKRLYFAMTFVRNESYILANFLDTSIKLFFASNSANLFLHLPLERKNRNQTWIIEATFNLHHRRFVRRVITPYVYGRNVRENV